LIILISDLIDSYLRNVDKKVGRDPFHRLKQAPVPWHKHLYRRYRRLLGDPRYQKKSIRI